MVDSNSVVLIYCCSAPLALNAAPAPWQRGQSWCIMEIFSVGILIFWIAWNKWVGKSLPDVLKINYLKNLLPVPFMWKALFMDAR